MIAWERHTEGAATLLKLRGTAQLQTELGFRLFISIRNQLVRILAYSPVDLELMLTGSQYHYCMQTRQQLPTWVAQITDTVRRRTNEQGGGKPQYTSRITAIITSFCNLRAEATVRSKILSPETILDRALAINDDFNQWRDKLPADWMYNTFKLKKPNSTVHAGYYYLWSDLGHAVHYNSYWMTAIRLHALIIQQYETLRENLDFYSSKAEYYASQIQNSRTTILTLIEHVCASLHYHISLCRPALGSQFSEGSDPLLLPSFTAILAILKPLFVAGDSDFCPPHTRDWIAKQLRSIGWKLGLRQALFLADTMMMRQDIADVSVRDHHAGDSPGTDIKA